WSENRCGRMRVVQTPLNVCVEAPFATELPRLAWGWACFTPVNLHRSRRNSRNELLLTFGADEAEHTLSRARRTTSTKRIVSFSLRRNSNTPTCPTKHSRLTRATLSGERRSRIRSYALTGCPNHPSL